MPNILVIDQDAHIRRLIRQVLQRVGYGVAEAATCAEVSDQLIACLPDIIVLDCQLGGGGLGLDLLWEIRTMPRTRDIPVVVTTGLPDAETDERLRHCGASAYLLKPFGPRDLVQAVAIASQIKAPLPAPGGVAAS